MFELLVLLTLKSDVEIELKLLKKGYINEYFEPSPQLTPYMES